MLGTRSRPDTGNGTVRSEAELEVQVLMHKNSTRCVANKLCAFFATDLAMFYRNILDSEYMRFGLDGMLNVEKTLSRWAEISLKGSACLHQFVAAALRAQHLSSWSSRCVYQPVDGTVKQKACLIPSNLSPGFFYWPARDRFTAIFLHVSRSSMSDVATTLDCRAWWVDLWSLNNINVCFTHSWDNATLKGLPSVMFLPQTRFCLKHEHAMFHDREDLEDMHIQPYTYAS